MRVLVVNAGSSSLKLRLLGPDDTLLGSRDLTADAHADAALRELGADADAVGHRVVHGGPAHTAAVTVDDALLADLHRLVELAPLHQPPALEALGTARALLPHLPQVACFDTAFHSTLPPAAATYAVPAQWRAWGVRRFGFHGLAHAWAAQRARALLGVERARRLVTCQLGSGASLCAVLDGRSVDTTMGFTPLEGLVMATRSGTVDPGLLLWLQRERGLPVEEVEDALERRSGLLALAGTGDMREVIARSDAGDGDARLALDVTVHRLRAAIGAMTAALGGLDALVFSGGVGEHAPRVRADVVGGLAHLGLELDAAASAALPPDLPDATDVATAGAAARTLVVPAREDRQIAGEVRRLLGGG